MVDIIEVGAPSAREEYGGAPHRAERPHGGIDAPYEHPLGPSEERARTGTGRGPGHAIPSASSTMRRGGTAEAVKIGVSSSV